MNVAFSVSSVMCPCTSLSLVEYLVNATYTIIRSVSLIWVSDGKCHLRFSKRPASNLSVPFIGCQFRVFRDKSRILFLLAQFVLFSKSGRHNVLCFAIVHICSP